MRFGIAAALMAALAFAVAAFASADPLGSATFYKEGLRPSPVILNVAPGPDGNTWFVDNALFSGTPAIGRIAPSGEIQEYISGTNLSGLNEGSNPNTIVAGPGGSKYLWFTDRNESTPAIGVIDSASPETATEFSIQEKGGNENSRPVSIAVGPEGNLWFTDASEETAPAIGMVELSGENGIKKIEEFSIGLNVGSMPQGIVAGPDKNLWFTDGGTTKAIGRINPNTKEIKEFATGESLPGGNNSFIGPWGIAAGPDGYVWFTDGQENDGKVCSITPSGTISCFKKGLVASSTPTGLTAAGGKLWFTDNSGVEEEQEVEINATENLGGTYTLSFGGKETGATGKGDLFGAATGKGDVKFVKAKGNRTSGSAKLTNVVVESGTLEVGMRIEGNGFTAAENTITAIEGAGPFTVTMSKKATSTGTAGAFTAGWIINVSTETGAFGFGQPISGTGIAASNTIIAVGGSTITPSKPTTAAGTAVSLTATGSKVISNVTNVATFSVGEQISGTGIPAETTITAINETAKRLTLSAAATAAGTGVSLSANLPYNATGTAVTEALGKLSTIGANNVTTSGVGTSPPIKRVVTFEGPLKNLDVEQLSCNGAGLTGTSPTCTVTTTEPGVPNAIGCMTTAGKACGEVTRWSLAALFAGGFGITNGSDGNLWLSTGFGPGTELGKFGIECVKGCSTNLRTLTITKNANGPGGTGSVSSKPKGIKCGATCSSAIARMYKSTPVELTAKPATGSAFVKWENAKESGSCDGSTNPVCVVPMAEDESLEAVFSGASKTITPTEALTVSKGESSGKGTVKGPGLGCEAECSSTVVLIQGPITEPKVKPGKIVVLKQAPAFGSKFSGWSGCESEPEGNCQVAMETAKEVTAEYEALPNKVLTVNKEYAKGNGSVSSKPKGIACGTTCTQSVAQMPEGAAVELIAKPSTGTFVKWEGGDCNGSTNPVCIVTMNTDETTKAVFSEPGKAIAEAKTLTLNKAGSGFGTVKASGIKCEALCSSQSALYQGPLTEPKVKPGKIVILKATSAPGSKAVAWTGCDSNPSPSECSVEMDEAHAVTATFDELE